MCGQPFAHVTEYLLKIAIIMLQGHFCDLRSPEPLLLVIVVILAQIIMML